MVKFHSTYLFYSHYDGLTVFVQARFFLNNIGLLRIKVSSLVDDILDGKVDIETCGECNNQIMDELQKRLTKIEDDTNAFKTAIEAFGQDDQVSLIDH